MIIVWDPLAVPIHNVMFERRSISRSGGQTLTGIEQVVASSTDFWEAKIVAKIRNAAQRLAYRGYKAQSMGRVGEWVIPVCEPLYQSTPFVEWSDEFGPDFSLSLDARATSAAIVGDTSLSLSMTDPTTVPQPGHYFSYGTRLYILITVAGGGGIYTVTFAPKARQTIPSGAALNFSNPVCSMRLANDTTGQMDRESLRFADIELQFVEMPV